MYDFYYLGMVSIQIPKIDMNYFTFLFFSIEFRISRSLGMVGLSQVWTGRIVAHMGGGGGKVPTEEYGPKCIVHLAPFPKMPKLFLLVH